MGGKGTDPYLQLYNIYYQKADYDNALAIAQKLTALKPDNSDYLNMEYNIYAKTKRLPEAKALMEKRANADPNDKESRYFVGLICNELKDIDGTMKWMKEAVKVDPDYYDALLVIAKLTYGEGQKLRNERNAITGSKDADLKKRQELFKQIPVKFKEAQPYWEKCVELKPEEEAFFGLYSVYSDIASFDPAYEAKIAELKRKAKAAGVELD
jgi:tetratricopeptide (TPR) repeat protein